MSIWAICSDFKGPTHPLRLLPFNLPINRLLNLKLRCNERFTHEFTACGCVFKEITLVGSNQGNYFENVIACSKRTLKTTVATQLVQFFYSSFLFYYQQSTTSQPSRSHSLLAQWYNFGPVQVLPDIQRHHHSGKHVHRVPQMDTAGSIKIFQELTKAKNDYGSSSAHAIDDQNDQSVYQIWCNSSQTKYVLRKL